MTCNIIATGSRGNAILLNGAYLLDCGVPFSKLKHVYKGIKIVFLTHVHMDHANIKTIKKLHKERPTLRFACPPWFIETMIDAGINQKQIDLFEPGEAYFYLNGLEAICKEIPHDVRNCAWDLVLENAESVFYATDCGTLAGIEARDRDFYLLEGNYKESELQERIAEKYAKGEFSYETRVEQSHLSEEQAMLWLSENAGPNSRYILIHRHMDER